MRPEQENALVLVKVAATILVLETTIHLCVRSLPLGRAASLLDSVLLAALATPVFYFWIIREHQEKTGWKESHRESEERFRALATHTSLGIYVIDGSRFLYVNPAFARIFGYSEKEILALTPLELVVETERGKVAQNIRRRQEGLQSEIDYTFTGKRKDGSRVELEIKGSVLELEGSRVAIGTLNDITSRVRESARLKEALQSQARLNELLRLSLEAAPLPQKLSRMLDCLVSTPWFAVEKKGCVMVREGGMLRMAATAGFSQACMAACARLPLGSCPCGRVAQTGEEILAAGIDPRHDVSYEGMPSHGHLTLPLKGGGELLGALSLYLKDGDVPDADEQEFARAAAGIFSGVILVARSEERFLQSQKMEAVGRLAGGVAHDFNNILTAIKGYAGFLRAALGADDPRRGDVAEITKAADRAADLTGRLLAFSRRQVLEPRPLDLNGVVKGMATMMRCLVGDGISVELDLEPALAATTADKGQLEQVIMNLVVNARDAMPRGGRVTISTANASRSGAEGGPSESSVRVSVADTGTGIEPAVLKHIFEPFFSTKPKEKGTGLGLSTVYGIVKQSGGDIEVSSAPGKGSVFKVILPALHGSHRPTFAADAEEASPAPCGRETVLVVVDEAPVRAIVERNLSRAGYRVLSAATGEDALLLLASREAPVDLLITDIILPRMDGRQLAERARAAWPSVKVLYLSGYSDGALSDNGVLRPGVALLPKPFSAEALAARVREALDAQAPASSTLR